MSRYSLRWWWPAWAPGDARRSFADLRSQVDADIRAQIRRTSPTPLFEDTRNANGDPGLSIVAPPMPRPALHMAALAAPIGGLL